MSASNQDVIIQDLIEKIKKKLKADAEKLHSDILKTSSKLSDQITLSEKANSSLGTTFYNIEKLVINISSNESESKTVLSVANTDKLAKELKKTFTLLGALQLEVKDKKEIQDKAKAAIDKINQFKDKHLELEDLPSDELKENKIIEVKKNILSKEKILVNLKKSYNTYENPPLTPDLSPSILSALKTKSEISSDKSKEKRIIKLPSDYLKKVTILTTSLLILAISTYLIHLNRHNGYLSGYKSAAIGHSFFKKYYDPEFLSYLRSLKDDNSLKVLLNKAMENAYERKVFDDLQEVTEKLVKVGRFELRKHDTVGFKTNPSFIKMMKKEYDHSISFEVLWGSTVLFSELNMPTTVSASSICRDSFTSVYLRYNILVEDWVFPFDLIIMNGDQVRMQLNEEKICK